MPVHKIQVSEYECNHCGHKWINRVNGKDGPTPSRCAKCKRTGWNSGGEGYMFSDERSLRRRLMIQHTTEDIHGAGYVYPYLQDELTKTFLYSITPRPTVKELASVLTEEDKQKRKKIMRHIIQSRSKPAA